MYDINDINQTRSNMRRNSMSILEKLRTLLAESAGANLSTELLDPDEDLLARGIIDSLGVLKVIVALENMFGIEVMDEDVVPENFQSLNCLAKFVEQKRSTAAV
jgi:acyl carrier protein